MEDTESDDGNTKEPDSSGIAEVISHSILHSHAVCEEDADESALRDLMLLMNDDLCELDTTESEEKSIDMEVEETKNSKKEKDTKTKNY